MNKKTKTPVKIRSLVEGLKSGKPRITRVACTVMVCSAVGLSVARLQCFAFSRFRCGLLFKRTMIGRGEGGNTRGGKSK